jgi:eukaryotic-like serine/threonine-protein kinase
MRYTAFISYSHADEAWARWLMRRLETYRVPPRLVGRQTAQGTIASRLGKFFRDRDELTASGDLGATIRSALADASALIVICSPAAAASRWVDAEVQAFRDGGRGDRVLAFVVAGDPGQLEGEQACFPPSLVAPGEDGQPVEPLAADARKEGDGRERAFLKLVAGLLGVGFDQLAQREAQRKQRRLVQIAVASLAGMALAIGLAATAYVARNDAERRQAQAEDILGFMLGDLREKLTTVGRLDLMRTVDDKATGYFASLDPRDLSDATLEEQARSLTGIGQVRLDEGNHPEAMAAFREALARSTALYEREPDNGQRLYDLSQAEFWIGFVAFQQGDYDTTETWFRKYRDSAIRLAAKDPGNFDWQREVGYGHHNLAVLDERRGRYAEAERAMREESLLYQTWLKQRPDDLKLRDEASDNASWLGSLALRQGHLADAETYFGEQVAALRYNIAKEPRNLDWQENYILALQWLMEAQAMQGKVAEARSSLDLAMPLATELHKQDASNNLWRLSLGRCHWWQAQLDAREDSPAAMSTASAAAELLDEAHRIEPENEIVLSWLVLTKNLQCQLALAEDDLSTASRNCAEAERLARAAFKENATELLRIRLAESRLLQGDLAQRRGEPLVARQAWREVRRLLTADTDSTPFERLDPLLRAMTALGERNQAEPLRQRLHAAGYVPLRPFADATPGAAQ